MCVRGEETHSIIKEEARQGNQMVVFVDERVIDKRHIIDRQDKTEEKGSEKLNTYIHTQTDSPRRSQDSKVNEFHIYYCICTLIISTSCY